MNNKEIEDQASGWLAVFTNENGNVALCQVIFDSNKQAQSWARAQLLAAGATQVTVKDSTLTGEVKGGLFGTTELTWTLLPAIHAEALTEGADIAALSHGLR